MGRPVPEILQSMGAKDATEITIGRRSHHGVSTTLEGARELAKGAAESPMQWVAECKGGEALLADDERRALLAAGARERKP